LNLANASGLRHKGWVQQEAKASGCVGGAMARGGLAGRLLVLMLVCATLVAGHAASARAEGAADGNLLKAARLGDVSLAKAAIAEGANVNCAGTNGLTPLLQTLHGASAPVDEGRRECIAVLLKSGADVLALDRNRQTALIYATRAGDLDTVRLLIDAGAIIKWRDGFHKTAVLYAAEGGHKDILLYLGQTLKVQQKQSAW